MQISAQEHPGQKEQQRQRTRGKEYAQHNGYSKEPVTGAERHMGKDTGHEVRKVRDGVGVQIL